MYDTVPLASSGSRPKDDSYNNTEVVSLNDQGNENRRRKRKEFCSITVVILTSIAALLLCVLVLIASPFQQRITKDLHANDREENNQSYLFDDSGKSGVRVCAFKVVVVI